MLESTLRWIGAALFTVLVPGTVTVLLPYYLIEGSVEVGVLGPLDLVAGLALLVGAAVYLRCLWDFVCAGRGLPAPVDHPKKLVVRGLYRYVRNPMYVGVLLVLVGEVLLLRSRPLLWYAGLWLGVINVVVLAYEEPYLRERFGESYEQYRRSVGRWIPGRPYASAGSENDP